MVLGTPVYEIGNPVYWRVGLQVAITFIIAEFSYRFIEKPIRKHGFRSFLRQYFAINILKWRRFPLVRKIATILPPLVLLVFTVGMTDVVKSEQHKGSMDSYPTQVKINHEEQPSSSIGSVTSSSEKKESIVLENNSSNQENGKEFVQKVEQNNETLQKEKTETSVPPINKTYLKILAIGDSVMLDIAGSLHKKYPDMTIDGKVGRQVSQAVQLAQSYANFNQPNHAVILELGTNGYFTHTQIDSLLQSFSKAHIYLVNTRVPRPWESKVNSALEAKAKENDHITLINWHSAAINHPEYFAPDGVHLVPKGIEALTTLIDQMINSNMK
ncbi:hypothetical protein [Peribacillus loiseleuriae]|uniref:SGNH/GDSL hydrolase family protein n=1 Tax=Peribacillus loiseleuriae TaxID=1679170 RepID=UPI003D072415